MSDFRLTTPPRWTSRFEDHPEPPIPRLTIDTEAGDDSSSSGHPDCVSYCTTPESTPPTSPTILRDHELSYAEDAAETSTRLTLLACLLVGLALSLWEPAPKPTGVSVHFADRPFESALLALKHAWPEGRRGVAVFLLITFGVVMVVRSVMSQRAGAAVRRPDEKNSLPWGLRGSDVVNMESQMSVFWEGMRVQ
ncbi:unnamed protein product [Peniophora sp. CBMAI 1063]|nr:unnamed protein product [Peniophora sp. CBMAI 1063]